MSKNKQKLIIIDGNAIIHRSFHALPPTLRTKDGVLVNAVYGFTSFLLKALSEFKPEFIILTLDKAGPTFRHEAYAEYKATRTKAPDELYEQIPLAKDVAKAFDIPIFELNGFEADDLIGTLSRQAEQEKNLETIIMTGDMDTLQLVDEKIKVYTMSRGLSDSILYDEVAVMERYGLRPEQIIDYKALRGDPSDNIPGVRGIGEKTAVELLQKFLTLDKVYEAAKRKDGSIKERTTELLITSETEAFLSRELATINCQAPIELLLDKARFSAFDLDKVLKLFSEFEFRSLLGKLKDVSDRLKKNSGDTEEVVQEAEQTKDKKTKEKEKTDYRMINSDKELTVLVKKIEEAKCCAIYGTTTSLDVNEAELTGLAFSLESGQAEFVSINDKALAVLKPILESDTIKKTGHDLKTVWRLSKRLDINVKGLKFDVMIAAYLLSPGERRNDLDSLVFSELSRERSSQASDKNSNQLAINFEVLDLEKIGLLACESADLIGQLEKKLSARLKEVGLEKVMQEIEMPLISVLGLMEEIGINLDAKLLEKASLVTRKKIATLTEKICDLAGKKFNISSTKQLKEVLFEDLEIPTDGIKKTKTGFSTAEEELNKLKDLHPIIAFVQEYRELTKLESTYLNALPKLKSPRDGKIHSSFNQTVAATGRLSSTEPNLQNIPTRTEEGRHIRNAFVAEKGFKLVGFDYSQIELRVAAHISQDKKMMAAFNSQEDIHTATAAAINGVSLTEVTKEMRREAKAINFGILYGQGPHGLSQGAGISYAEARQFINKYFNTYAGVKKMIDGFIEDARKHGYAKTLFGRKRPLADLESNIPAIKRGAERMAINTPIQGTAADLIKLAMINVAKLLENKQNEARLLLQVHDELIFEIKEDKISDYTPKLKKIMESAADLSVPIIVEENIGDNWGELK